MIAAFLIVSAQKGQARSPETAFRAEGFSAGLAVFADEAQTKAITQPRNVQPKNRFTRKIDVPFTCFLFEATNVGRK
ncbi:hypothetical protein D9M71_780530 [compost metagenome]